MEDNIYEKKSINHLILYFSIPAILSLIVEIMASVVDTAFAGHLGLESIDALTAMGLVTPLLNLFTAIQSLFAVSTSIFIAKYLNDKLKRDEYFASGIIMTLIVSSLLSIACYLGINQILNILNAKAKVYLFAKSYLKVQFISNIFSSLGYTLTSVIRSFGYPKIEMLITTLAVFVNIIFNGLFVFGLNFGFIGLALGTLFSEIFCALYAYLWLKKHCLLPNSFHLSLKRFKDCTKELSKLGIAQAIIQAMGGCTGFFVNNSLMIHSGSVYVAVWNVVSNIYTLFLMPIVGITQAVQTIIAYFSGQGKNKEKNKTIRSTIATTVLYGIIATAIVFVFSNQILAVFIKDVELITIANSVIKIIFISFSITGIFYTIMTLLEITEHETKAVIMILTRQVFLIVPLVYVLPIILHKLSLAIFLAVPIADIVALCISLLLVKKHKCRLIN